MVSGNNRPNYSFSKESELRASLKSCYNWFRSNQTITTILLAIMLAGCGFLVYYTGGIKYVYAHFMYIPIVLAAILFRTGGGVAAAITGGIILGPFMPIDTITGQMQEPVNWLIRLGIFTLIGSLVGYVTSALQERNIELQAKVEEGRGVYAQLQEWQDLMEYIIRHDPNAIAVHDRDLNYIYVSNRYLQDYRVERKDVIGKHHYDIFPDIPEKWRNVHQRALAGEIISAERNRFERADGTVDYTRWQCRPWHRGDGSIGGIILYTEVITERVEAEEALRQLNLELEQRVVERTAQLEAKNKELEVFTYSVSHDLKAPLRGIDGYSKLLLEDHGHFLNEEGLFFLNTIRDSVAQMSCLIDDLLAYSRLEQRSWQDKEIDLAFFINSSLIDYKEEIDNRRGNLKIEVPAVKLHLDPEGLRIVLRNLLDNALKYSSDDEPPAISIGGQENEHNCLVWVSDNGIGFDMKYHDRIFDIFQRLHRIEDYPGTGVGLASVRKAMERMGGRIWAESAPGEGATFFMEIPLSRQELKNKT